MNITDKGLEMNHTPLPWAVEQGTQITCPSMPKRVWGLHDEYNANFLVVQTNLYVSADKAAQAANAQFIVRACNAHEGLVKALEAITELYNTDEGCRSTPEYVNARAALAAAKGA